MTSVATSALGEEVRPFIHCDNIIWNSHVNELIDEARIKYPGINNLAKGLHIIYQFS